MINHGFHVPLTQKFIQFSSLFPCNWYYLYFVTQFDFHLIFFIENRLVLHDKHYEYVESMFTKTLTFEFHSLWIVQALEFLSIKIWDFFIHRNWISLLLFHHWLSNCFSVIIFSTEKFDVLRGETTNREILFKCVEVKSSINWSKLYSSQQKTLKVFFNFI